ncbi:tyrosine-type recombinase/integrase [Nocardia vinacea]|uniref:Tyrosine-type recombinase/integrase n=1 Tax=Nocardia vinacea TaxID=96468 RepID=A0ABZ1YLW3_9NOCA|nr:tyrosine-type recombinase/integrase [Nocardia vinacea]
MANSKTSKRAANGTASIKWDEARGVFRASQANPNRSVGPRRLEAYSTDRTEALNKLDAMVQRAKKGLSPTLPTGSVAEWLADWLDFVKTRRAPKTYDNYYRQIHHHVIPRIGKKKLRELTPADVNAMYDEIVAAVQAAGNGKGIATARSIHRTLNSAFNTAVQRELIDTNRVRLAEPPKAGVSERRSLTADQAMHLLRTGYENEHPFTACLAILLFTGTRLGEAIGTTWDRTTLASKLDGTGGNIDVTWQLQSHRRKHGCGTQRADKTWPCGRKRGNMCPHAEHDMRPDYEHVHILKSLYLTRPKSSASIRLLPMTPQLNAIMTWQGKETYQLVGNDHGFVTVDPRYEEPRPLSPKYAWELFKDLVRLAGMPEDIIAHEMRHTTVSLLTAAGVEPTVIQMICGHANLATTQIYTHINQALAASALGQLDALMNLGLPGPNRALSA